MSFPIAFLTWGEIDAAAPRLAAPMRAYLTQIATTLRPESVRGTDLGLRCLAQFLIEKHPAITTVTALPASAAGPEMTRLHREMHQRMLGNGFCTRPPDLDCTFESVCETCTFFQTTIAFRPTLQAQHDHAATHDQTARQQLFAGLLDDLDESAS